MRFNISLLLAIMASSSPLPSSSASGFSPLAATSFFQQRRTTSSSSSSSFSSSALSEAPAAVDTNDLLERTVRGGGDDDSDEEVATPSLTQPLCEAPDLDSIADAPLISDIEMLSNMLADVVKRENPTVYDLYTTFRKLGMDRAANPNDVASIESFETMKKLAYDISPRDALGVMKTFSIALNLVNAAEVHHRMRAVRETDKKAEQDHVGPLPMVEDSIRGTMEILLDKDTGAVSGGGGGGRRRTGGGVDPDKIFDKLITQKCEIVLTAHPTEVNRKTIIRKCECFFVQIGFSFSRFAFSLVRIFPICLILPLSYPSLSYRSQHFRIAGVPRTPRSSSIRACRGIE